MKSLTLLALFCFSLLACGADTSEEAGGGSAASKDPSSRPAKEAAFAVKAFDEVRKGSFEGLIPMLRPERGFMLRHKEHMEKAQKLYGDGDGDEYKKIEIAREVGKFGIEDIENATLAEWAAKRELHRRSKYNKELPNQLKVLGTPIFDDDESEGAWWIARLGPEATHALCLAIKTDEETKEYYVSYIDFARWEDRAQKSKE